MPNKTLDEFLGEGILKMTKQPFMSEGHLSFSRYAFLSDYLTDLKLHRTK